MFSFSSFLIAIVGIFTYHFECRRHNFSQSCNSIFGLTIIKQFTIALLKDHSSPNLLLDNKPRGPFLVVPSDASVQGRSVRF